MRRWLLQVNHFFYKHLILRHRYSNDSWKHVKSGETTIPLSRFPLKLSSGKIARFADGSCVAQLGDTSVMVTTVCISKTSSLSYVPLSVDYRQKAAAAGRIPTTHFRRETGITDQEILTGRVIDRSVRPLFPKGFNYETQISCNLLAVDGVHDPAVVSINAASAALAISDIPWNGPVGAVRIGLIDGNVVINPTRKECAKSSLNLVVAATELSHVVMLEGSGDNVLQQELMKALKTGVKETQLIIKGIKELQRDIGKPKRNFESPSYSSEIKESTELLCEIKARDIFTDYSHDKLSRDKTLEILRLETVTKLKEHYPETEDFLLHDAVVDVFKQTFRTLILETGKRCDGREANDLRDIHCAVDLYSPLHGSALFQRGQTQVFCTVAFDSLDSVLRSDPISVITGGIKEKNFMLHYEFPQYSVNDTERGAGRAQASRRSIGHGALAEKSLRPVVPSNFPFTIRLTSEVLESNGSSSMASVCGGCLALMDAGVPISAPVAGVAIGLISIPSPDSSQEISEYKILTDIMGLEDYIGDMDFKMAGSKKGITGLQLDVKIPGLPLRIVMESIKQATEAKSKILNIMKQAIAKPREEKKLNSPISEKLEIPAHKRSKFFGFGGYNIKKLTSETGVQITAIDDGAFSIFAPNQDAMNDAKEAIEALLAEENVPELEFGAIYTAKIVEIRETGVMVTLYSNMSPALLHNSQLDQRKIHHPNALNMEVGQEISVKYFGRDPASGNMRLSRKVLQAMPSYSAKNLGTLETPDTERTTNSS